MNVNFAVQLLSSTIENVLKNYYGDKTDGTSGLCEYMDKFLYCLNVRNQT